MRCRFGCSQGEESVSARCHTPAMAKDTMRRNLLVATDRKLAGCDVPYDGVPERPDHLGESMVDHRLYRVTLRDTVKS